MYTAARVIQYLGIAFMLWGFFKIYSKKLSYQKQLLLIVLCAVLINQIGYALEMESTTPEAALTSIKFAYVGKLMAEFGIFFFVMAYCKVNIPKWITRVLLALHFLILGMVWTCDKHNLYYSNISFTTEGFFPHVVLKHGIFYNLFMALTFGYMIIMFAVSTQRLILAKGSRERTRMVFMMLVPVSFVSGLLLFQSGVTRGYDTTALAYVFSSVILLLALLRYDLIDEEELAKDIIIDELGEAVFVLDKKDHLVYQNKKFRALFSDSRHRENSEFILAIQEFARREEEYKSGGTFYKILKEIIMVEGHYLGCIYMLHDVTDFNKRMALIERYNTELEAAVEQKTKHLQKMQDQLVLGMADMVENRDSNTGGHIKRTSELARIFAKQISRDKSLNLDRKFFDDIIKAAPMHDLGKITIDDSILKKPGEYTPEEYANMKKHAEMGGTIVHRLFQGVEDDHLVRITENIAHYHHENYDGTGYPDGLKGEEIPFEARIMAVVDV
ncbi:MAG: HD domain-containing protein, partial [Clostridiales bacterium]|nr:HD domain-containing protein [Candidatus Blautia equi]